MFFSKIDINIQFLLRFNHFYLTNFTVVRRKSSLSMDLDLGDIDLFMDLDDIDWSNRLKMASDVKKLYIILKVKFLRYSLFFQHDYSHNQRAKNIKI